MQVAQANEVEKYLKTLARAERQSIRTEHWKINSWACYTTVVANTTCSLYLDQLEAVYINTINALIGCRLLINAIEWKFFLQSCFSL